MKRLMFVLILLFSMHLVEAGGAYSFFNQNQEADGFANCLEDGVLQDVNNASLTIYYPNTSIFIDAVNMTKYKTGQFNYSFITPNITGVYAVEIYCSNGQTDFGSFQIKNLEEEIGMAYVAIILGLLGVIAFFTYIGFYLLNRPLNFDKYATNFAKLLNIKTLGMMILLATTWLIIPLTSYMGVISSLPIFNTITILMLWLIPAFNLAFFSIYIILIVFTEWGVKNSRYNQR